MGNYNPVDHQKNRQTFFQQGNNKGHNVPKQIETAPLVINTESTSGHWGTPLVLTFSENMHPDTQQEVLKTLNQDFHEMGMGVEFTQKSPGLIEAGFTSLRQNIRPRENQTMSDLFKKITITHCTENFSGEDYDTRKNKVTFHAEGDQINFSTPASSLEN